MVLSREEVWKILGLVKDVRYRACLTLIYSCGLRCGEAVNVKVGDIDSGQGLLYIRNGKGCKSRAVPLPSKTLKILREMWRTHHHPELLFPAYHLNMRLNPSRYGCKDKPFSRFDRGNTFPRGAVLFRLPEDGHGPFIETCVRHKFAGGRHSAVYGQGVFGPQQHQFDDGLHAFHV